MRFLKNITLVEYIGGF